MSSLPTALRRQLETACKDARRIATIGARKALETLAVHEPEPYRHMDDVQRELRCKLRAQAKQLGDAEIQTKRGAHEIKHLVEKLAYDQWHRLLFARFLLENNLLISPEHGVSVTLDDCEELAPTLGLKDAWAVAARYAAKELPQIFRADDSAGAVELAVEDRKPLIQLVTDLPLEVFTANDSLGWCYQFWQAERKDEVNASGNKIGADELPAVTQLFTEDYMVDFLLDNTLGAWYASRALAATPALAENAKTEEALRNAVALPGCPWRYLRFIKAENGTWTPAAGTFHGWPKTARELKCLDPCMGSGHFVVAMFERLVALRVAEERLDEAVALEAVIHDNLFGLEIDQRCTQIAAFNLALAAWRRVGHCVLPAMNLACSGLAPNTKQVEWLKLAAENEKLRNGMELLYGLFRDAPVLGSLVNPRAAEASLLVAAFHELQPLLEKALAQEAKDDTAHEMSVTARGLGKAAEILAGQFTFVATNVPYLGRGKQDDRLLDFCERNYRGAKADLATCFVERCSQLCAANGTTALVTAQNWWFLGSFRAFRGKLLTEHSVHMAVTLGEEAWQSFGDRGPSAVLMVVGQARPGGEARMAAIHASPCKTIQEKIAELVNGDLHMIAQARQYESKDHLITITEPAIGTLLGAYANCFQGVGSTDMPRFIQLFWEHAAVSAEWDFYHMAPTTAGFSNLCGILFWQQGLGDLAKIGTARKGLNAYGKRGVAVAVTRYLTVSHFLGSRFDCTVAAILPKQEDHLAAIVAYVFSAEFIEQVRQIDQAVSVTESSFVKVPFNIAHWQKVAAEKYPAGLPKPFSSDPTQWLFNGHPKASDQPLHVAVARLLGYRWPRQTGSSFPDCPALGPDGLEELADHEGIVCLSASKGEAPAAERLRVALVRAVGKFDLSALIASAGPKGSKSRTLEDWLRDEFFEQHCALFDSRPFVWQIWDGHSSGFSALVNYHKLTYESLERLTYVRLGDWIRRQQDAADAGEAGSDARGLAAKRLQAQLKLILQGEPPHDLFVRWKPLSKQAIGWHPDLNDGVRLNIRPFLAQDIPGGKRGAGILRSKPNIKWAKDKGKEPVRDKKDFPWFWGWDEETQDFAGVGDEPDGNRWNDCHYSNEFKRKAREG
jgi:hypothetical protein